jgi:hypothetical protein
MPLFRLDYIDADGTITDPVRGSDIEVLTLAASSEDILTYHMTKAREYAKDAASAYNTSVQIAGIIKGGVIKPRLIIHPDGSATRPGGTKPGREQDDCKAQSGQPCFCPPCRAKRRASK